MEIHSEKFDLSDADVELIFRLINAEKAKRWINAWNYFRGNNLCECLIRPEDIKWLEKQCSYDFTVIPDKTSDDYPDWEWAMICLCEMNLYIFEPYRGGVISSLCDHIKEWSENRQQRDDTIVEELTDETLGNLSDNTKNKDVITRAIITSIVNRSG